MTEPTEKLSDPIPTHDPSTCYRLDGRKGQHIFHWMWHGNQITDKRICGVCGREEVCNRSNEETTRGVTT